MQLLYDHINHKPDAGIGVYLPHQVVYRETTAQKR